MHAVAVPSCAPLRHAPSQIEPARCWRAHAIAVTYLDDHGCPVVFAQSDGDLAPNEESHWEDIHDLELSYAAARRVYELDPKHGRAQLLTILPFVLWTFTQAMEERLNTCYGTDETARKQLDRWVYRVRLIADHVAQVCAVQGDPDE